MSDDTPKPPSAAELRTMASERRRRERKATVGEVEDGLRNFMRLVKQQLAARDALIESQNGVIDTLCAAIESLETAVRELNPGWAGITATEPPPVDLQAHVREEYDLDGGAPSIFDAPIPPKEQ